MYWNDPEFIKEISEELCTYSEKTSQSGCEFLVAEENGEILGFGGFRKIDIHFKQFATTNNPAELHVIAVRQKRNGVGKELKQKLIDEARIAGFTELLIYSPNTHTESWPFHDLLGFERIGETTPPDDGAGQVWRKVL